MVRIVIMNAVIKGYHEFKIKPPMSLALKVTKEYGNKFDNNACLIWMPEQFEIPRYMWDIITDKKRGETVTTIAGLPVGRVPSGLSNCFTKMLSSDDIERIECEQTGDPCQSFPPWPAPQELGGGAVIPCTYTVVVKDGSDGLMALEWITSAVNNMNEKTVLQIKLV